MRAAVERYAQERQISNVEVIKAASPQVMLEKVKNAREGLFYMVVCYLQDEGALEAISAVRDADPNVLIALVSQDAEDAMKAFGLKATFMQIPAEHEDFVKAIGEPLEQFSDSHARPFAVKSEQGIDSLLLGDILFAESSRKGPIIHLPKGRTITVRGTLSALYERLVEADPEWFMKVGGSFIVNLDNVRSAGNGSLIFCDGEAVIVPVRMRKPLKDALTALNG